MWNERVVWSVGLDGAELEGFAMVRRLCARGMIGDTFCEESDWRS